MINPFILLIGIFFRKLIKIIFAPFIFIALYLFLSNVVEPLVLQLTNEIQSRFGELQGLSSVVSEVISYLEIFHAVKIILATLGVLSAIKMFSLALRAFGFGNNG